METDERVGTILLGKLRVVRRLGQGGAGTVYEVEHLITHRRHALKLLRPEKAEDPRAVARLVREASVAGRAGSPRLVETYDVGQLGDGSSYILMELVVGRTLSERLRQGRLRTPEAIQLGIQVAEGLSAAHAVGVVHRDLTPRNILLVPSASGEDVKILDFGLAKTLPGLTDRFGHLTEAGAVVGTPHYLSPEQARAGTVDARTDQYALGLILYESLSGVRPYDGDSLIEVLSNVVEGKHRPLIEAAPQIDPRLADAVERAMHADASKRFATLDELTAVLRAAAVSTGALRDLGTSDTERPPPPASSDALGFAVTAARPGLSALSHPLGYAETVAVESTSGAFTPLSGAIAPTRAAPTPLGRAETAPALPVARPPSRAGLWVLGALATLVPLVAFGVTGLVLQLRDGNEAPPTPVESPAAPSSAEERANIALLSELLQEGRYDDCVSQASQMRQTASVLTVSILCASGRRDGAAIFNYCSQLAAFEPDCWERNASCAGASDPFRADTH